MDLMGMLVSNTMNALIGPSKLNDKDSETTVTYGGFPLWLRKGSYKMPMARISNKYETPYCSMDGPCSLPHQLTRYYHGIGVGDATVDKWNKGITGRGCNNQIKQITKVGLNRNSKKTH
jgi:hypothetical protein